jgi:2Fe-2S ferredoxin
MATIIYLNANGETQTVQQDKPVSVMRAAIENGIDGIVGECGGQAMCATCHVYVDDGYLDRLPPISDDEAEMLDCTAADRDDARSRLGCQLLVGSPENDLDEIVVNLPATQV